MNEKDLKNFAKHFPPHRRQPVSDQELLAWMHRLNLESEPHHQDEREMQLDRDAMWTQIADTINRQRRRKAQAWRLGAAAMLLIGLLGSLLYYRSDLKLPAVSETMQTTDIRPGKNRAFLITADGKQIDLNENEHTIKVSSDYVMYEDGEIVSTIDGAVAATQTIRTPRGGQYKIILPDSTQVWLNAESSLRYPVRFDGNERIVKVEGEAFFEVRHRSDQPFIVETDLQSIRVLGTSFNVNAYRDEPEVTTTLVEGRVEITECQSGQSKILKPGQQANVSEATIQINEADLESQIAWKNGDFIFKKENIQSIMRKLARWYDIEVEFRGEPSNYLFSGYVSRSQDISAIFEMLDMTDQIKFRIDERRVIIMM